MNGITVTQRSDDFHACLAGQPGKWECGRTEAEAIGKLVISHAAELGVPLDRPDRSRTARQDVNVGTDHPNGGTYEATR